MESDSKLFHESKPINISKPKTGEQSSMTAPLLFKKYFEKLIIGHP
jgi:hypothetical protein